MAGKVGVNALLLVAVVAAAPSGAAPSGLTAGAPSAIAPIAPSDPTLEAQIQQDLGSLLDPAKMEDIPALREEMVGLSKKLASLRAQGRYESSLELSQKVQQLTTELDAARQSIKVLTASLSECKRQAGSGSATLLIDQTRNSEGPVKHFGGSGTSVEPSSSHPEPSLSLPADKEKQVINLVGDARLSVESQSHVEAKDPSQDGAFSFARKGDGGAGIGRVNAPSAGRGLPGGTRGAGAFDSGIGFADGFARNTERDQPGGGTARAWPRGSNSGIIYNRGLGSSRDDDVSLASRPPAPPRRRSAYEWDLTLSAASCESSSVDVEYSPPCCEVTLDGHNTGQLAELPACTAQVYLLLSTLSSTGTTQDKLNGWAYQTTRTFGPVRVDLWHKSLWVETHHKKVEHCLVSFGTRSRFQPEELLSDVSPKMAGDTFMPRSLVDAYDTVRAAIQRECGGFRVISIGHGAAAGLAQVMRAYGDSDESWTFNGIKACINGGLLFNSVSTFSKISDPLSRGSWSDPLSMLPADTHYTVYTECASNFELSQTRVSSGAASQLMVSSSRKEGTFPELDRKMIWPELQNHTSVNAASLREYLGLESVRELHWPPLSLEILDGLRDSKCQPDCR